MKQIAEEDEAKVDFGCENVLKMSKFLENDSENY